MTVEFTVPDAVEAITTAIGDRVLITQGDRTHTYSDIVTRANRLAAYLHEQGLGCHTARDDLRGHDVGQDLLGIYAHNGNEYVETLLGAFRARVAPFNVNYRYVKDELRYLLADSGATALVYHAVFAPRIAEILPDLPHLRVLIQIADSSDEPLLEGAVAYDDVVASEVPPPAVVPDPDDLYVLYTGGTTGMPKGVLWRQHDIFTAAFGGRDLYSGQQVASYDDLVARARTGNASKIMVLPPLMHGAAQWAVMTALTMGSSVVFASTPDRFDADEVARTVERERLSIVTVVGDAMARPLAIAAENCVADLSTLSVVANGGALLTPTTKQRLIDAIPGGVIVVDGVGSSETGAQLTHLSSPGAVSTGIFNPGPQTCVVSEDLTHVVSPGHEGIGWLAQRGSVPLGYKGDAVKTAATFPTVGGVRHAIPGDRARHLADGSVELLGRDSVTINSGGEKIFAEEVEIALLSHPAIADVVVAARPSELWGQEVVAVVALADDLSVSPQDLIDHAATTLARYKLPKAIVFRPHIERSPAGKADYRWARAQATESA